MSVKITDNSQQVKNETENKASLAIRFMLEAIHRTSTPVTPMEHGRLRSDVTKQVHGLRGTITWGKNYAIYQEEKQFRHYTTPGTGPHFAEDSVRKVMRDAQTYFRRAGIGQ